MTTFPRISTTTIGRNKDAPRVWLEGPYLLDAGFEPANRIEVEFKKGQVVIRLAHDGPRVVSSKRQGQIPVLDLNSTALTEAFGSITTLQVYIAAGEITLTLRRPNTFERQDAGTARKEAFTPEAAY